jgi:tetratricopeptide (TPR) repeat protein
MATIQSLLESALGHFQRNELPAAESLCREVLAADADNQHGHYLLSRIARSADDRQASFESICRAIAAAPDHPVYWFEKGTALRLLDRDEEALAAYRRAVELRPDFQEAHTNIGGILEELERFDEALTWCEKAVKMNPDCPQSRYNLGNVLRSLARLDESIAQYRRAVELKPDYLRARWNMAIVKLTNGQFAEGWENYECRAVTGEVAIDHYPQPPWDGSSLAGKSIVIHAEQGIGDEIMFASCFAEVIAAAERVVLVCEVRLSGLFQRSFPQAEVHGHLRRKDGSPARVGKTCDWQIPAGSLPRLLRRDSGAFPRETHYLIADPAQVVRWRQRFDGLGEGLKIGISWRAGGKPAERRKRTTTLDQWQSIFDTPGVHFVNLQYGETSEDLADAQCRLGVTIHDSDDGDPLVDMDDFAAKVTALDLVISVGNATVHAAGAVGTPGWAMLPLVPAWRWLAAGEQIPWYRSVWPIRQMRSGHWQPVFQQVTDRLRILAGVDKDTPVTVRSAPAQAVADAPPTPVTTDGPLSHRSDSYSAEAIDAACKKGIALHQSGDLADAESVYREILQHAPRCPDALHMLGVVAMQTDRIELAIKSIRRALAVSPAEAAAHFNLANAYCKAARTEEAIASYGEAIRLNDQFAAAHLNLGRLLKDQQQYDDAIASFERALEADPRSGEARLNLANVLKRTCRVDEAEDQYRLAIDQHPSYTEAVIALGTLLTKEGRLEEAAEQFRTASGLDQESSVGLNNLGGVMMKMKRPADAEQAYLAALERDPTSPDILGNLALAKKQQNEIAQAAALLQRAVELRPDVSTKWHSLGGTLQELGHDDDALACYDRAISLDENLAVAHCNRALLWLQQGDFARGWTEHEWRWHSPDGARPRDFFPWPAWDGSPLGNKTILVHGEQGIGDEIMYATCLPQLIADSRHCVILCSDRLQSLFGRSFPLATVCGVTRGQEHRWQPSAGLTIDVQIAAGSVPRFVRTCEADFPRQARLLTPDAEHVAQWRDRLSALGDGPKIGITWRAGTTSEDRRRRCMSLSQWRGLLQTPGVHFVNLQHGDCQDDLAAARDELGIEIHDFHEADPLHDLDPCAAQTAALDLVIGAGNASTHLAGALGIEAWALLPKHWGWRWLQNREESLWYQSVRLYRQRTAGDWSALLERVHADLARHRDATHHAAIDAVHASHGPVAGPHQPVFSSPSIGPTRETS